MTKSINLPQFSIKQMLEAGVHFGHKTMRRNPKMSKYIFGEKNGLSIIDLEQSANLLYNSLKIVKEIAKNNGRILFVSTKKQAFESIEAAAKRCGQYYVNHRWLGGMLTNWKTVSRSIKTLKNIEDQLTNDEIGLNKKERLVLDRQRQKLDMTLGGIRNMGGYPDLVVIIDINRENLAVAEAKKLGVPIMAIVDTNCNPEGINFPIPGNDDSVKAIKLYCRLISDAVLAGIKESMIVAGVDISKLEDASSEEILEVAVSAKAKKEDDKSKKNNDKFKKSRSDKSTKDDKKPLKKSPKTGKKTSIGKGKNLEKNTKIKEDKKDSKDVLVKSEAEKSE